MPQLSPGLPASITSLSREELALGGVEDLSRLEFLVPGFRYGQTGLDTGSLQVVKVSERATHRSALASIKTETIMLKSWLEQYPDSLIVEAPDRVTGIDYRFTPNDTSALGESVFSGLRITVEQIHPYTPVVGLVIDNKAVAIPASEVLHPATNVYKVGLKGD